MEMQFNRVSMLSLQELALRRFTVLLWNAPCNLSLVRNCRFTSSLPCDHPEDWNADVSDTLSKLELPETLAKQIKLISKPIGLQMLRWKLYHEAYLFMHSSFEVPILKKLQWTAAGAVDYRKTAEELVRCDVLAIANRYKLACLYCLHLYIPEVWKELPQKDKISFCEERIPYYLVRPLHSCWTYILRGEEYKLGQRIFGRPITFNEYEFQRSSYKGNKAAAKYFLQKLEPEERENSIMSTARSALSRSRNDNTYPSSFPNKNISDVVFYLLSEMTPEQQIQIFMEEPAEVFGCFFDWPWQDAFFDFSDTLWACMQCEDLGRRARNYNTLLDKMQRSIQKSDYYLPYLFQNIFRSCPTDFKKHLVKREFVFSSFFNQLFAIQDTETVKVILSNLNAEDRLRIASSERMLNLFKFSISKGREHMVEMFLQEAGLSNEDKVRLKEVVKRMGGGVVESGPRN